MDGTLGAAYVAMETDRPYLTMDSTELEEQYQPSSWARRRLDGGVVADHIDAITTGSMAAKASVPHQEGVLYGPTDKQRLDIFAPDTLPLDAPVYMYIHGGYWQELSRGLSSYVAEHVVLGGAVYVAMGYDLAPQASMRDIVSQIRRGMTFVIEMAKQRGSRGVYIGGHSAGGHLAAMMLSQDWDVIAGPGSQKLVKGALLISGVYDLRPIVSTTVNDALHMDRAEAWDMSPWNPAHLANLCRVCQQGVNVLVVIGEDDSPEFRRQSAEYEKVLRDNNISTDYLDVKGTDHFDVNDLQRNQDFVVTQKLLQLMQL